jgi:hypothetical protein
MTGVSDWDRDTGGYHGKPHPGAFGRCEGCTEWCMETNECPYLDEEAEDAM